MWNVKTKMVIFGLLLALAIGGVVLEAHATMGAVQDFHQQQVEVQHGDVRLIRSWMTVHYLASVYQVPETIIYQTLHIQRNRVTRHSTLEAIARQTNQPIDMLIHHVQDGIASYHKQHPISPPHQNQQGGSNF